MIRYILTIDENINQNCNGFTVQWPMRFTIRYKILQLKPLGKISFAEFTFMPKQTHTYIYIY